MQNLIYYHLFYHNGENEYNLCLKFLPIGNSILAFGYFLVSTSVRVPIPSINPDFKASSPGMASPLKIFLFERSNFPLRYYLTSSIKF